MCDVPGISNRESAGLKSVMTKFVIIKREESFPPPPLQFLLTLCNA